MRHLSCVLVLLLTLASATEARAQDYTFTNIVPFGSAEAGAHRINDVGQIVGQHEDQIARPDRFGFLLSGGVYTTIRPPGTISTNAARGINNSGQIVGVYFDGARNHGFLLNNGVYTTLDVPGSAYTFAHDINDNGIIVGTYSTGSAIHGFMLSGTGYTTLHVPGSTGTEAYGINSLGEIVGFYVDQSGVHGFLLSGGSYQTLVVPGSRQTIAQGINSFGQIVGFYSDANGTNHGFIFDRGDYRTFDVPGSTTTVLSGINNLGAIVGGYHVGSFGSPVAFLATPISIVALVSQIENISSLNRGVKNSLVSKLAAAHRSLERENRNAASGQLNAFINEVNALKESRRLDGVIAESWIAQAQFFINRL